MREKNRALIRPFKTFFRERYGLERKFPKIGRQIKMHFEHQAMPMVRPEPLRLLQMLDRILLGLA